MVFKTFLLVLLLSSAFSQKYAGISVSLNSNKLPNLFKKAKEVLSSRMFGVGIIKLISNYTVEMKKPSSFISMLGGEFDARFESNKIIEISLKQAAFEAQFDSIVTQHESTIFKETSTIRANLVGDFTFRAELGKIASKEQVFTFKPGKAKITNVSVKTEGYFSENIRQNLEELFTSEPNEIFDQVSRLLFENSLSPYLKSTVIPLSDKYFIDLTPAEGLLFLDTDKISTYPFGTVFSGADRLKPTRQMNASFEGLTDNQARINISTFPFESLIHSLIKKETIYEISKRNQPQADFSVETLKGAVSDTITNIKDSVFRLEVSAEPSTVEFVENRVVFKVNLKSILYATNREKREEKYIQDILGEVMFNMTFETSLGAIVFRFGGKIDELSFQKKDLIEDADKLATVLKPFYESLVKGYKKNSMVDLPLQHIFQYGEPSIENKGGYLSILTQAPKPAKVDE